MLEAIADFWKPSKKGSQEKLDPQQLQIGSTLGFGFVPQSNLSGRRLNVSAVNTYQFGDEALTSFVLTQERDAGVSMMIAETEGEQFLMISRRLSIGDRMKMFDSAELESVLTKQDFTTLPCKDAVPDFKGWTVAWYRRDIQGIKGRILKGDFRGKMLPPNEGQQFEYTLLVSDSKEHAIEIEKYPDGRMEIYATVYRRMSDVGEVTNPGSETARPEVKLFSKPEEKPAPKLEEPAKAAPLLPPAPPPPAPIKLQEFAQSSVQVSTPRVVEQPAKPATLFSPPVQAVKAPLPMPAPMPVREEKPTAIIPEPAKNGVNTMNPNPTTDANNKPKLFVQPPAADAYAKKEIKTVNNGATNNFDSEAIECDLRVANKIIDEAIRNEMRLNDIVRRIIELPVAYQEQVQIPVTLSDEDYSLLAIRYGIPASDKNAIKRRIIEDLNDFSGNNAAKKAA